MAKMGVVILEHGDISRFTPKTIAVVSGLQFVTHALQFSVPLPIRKEFAASYDLKGEGRC
jgi:hypothetical protein